MIEFLSLKKVNEKYEQSLKTAFDRVICRGQYILNEECQSFEREFSEYIGTKHAVGVGNGLDALTLIINAMGLRDKDEIIVPANSHIASVMAITQNNCTPVFAEPDAFTFNLNKKSLLNKITGKTKAIMVVHMYGQVAPMDEIYEVAKEHGLKIIEDAAHAHGAVYKGKKAGNLSHAAAFSFYPTKNLGALGDGGAVTTNDEKLAQRVSELRHYGVYSTSKNCDTYTCRNSRLDELQAAFLREKLVTLDASNQERRAVSRYYRENIKNPAVILPTVNDEYAHVWHQFVIRCKRREELMEHLLKNNIKTGIHYPVALHKLEDAKLWNSIKLPVSEKLSAEVLSLPIGSIKNQEDIDRVVHAINSWK